MLRVNEEKAFEMIKSLFLEIIKEFSETKKCKVYRLFLENKISQLKAIISILELRLDVDALCVFLNEFSKPDSSLSVSDFLQAKAIQDFLFWIHEGEMWHFVDFDKSRDFDYYCNNNHVRKSFAVTVWHNKNQPKYRILNSLGQLPSVLFIGELKMVAKVKTFSLEEAWALTQHLDCPWYENPNIETIEQSRSTDIGDVLEVGNNDFWLVKSQGFKRIEIGF